ncbi:MAG: phage infection protein [Parachlamydia sp.]|nr:MAG: phage infection protein [Parachlamydia sp.]
MKFFWIFAAVFLLLYVGYSFSFQQKPVNESSHELYEQDVLSDEDCRQISECIANIFWSHLINYYPYYDLKVVLARLEELSKTQTTPMNPQECRMTCLLPLLYKIQAHEAAKNLKTAELFLKELSVKKGITEVVKGKLYYEKLNEGVGMAIMLEDSPILSYDEYRLESGMKMVQWRNGTNIKITLTDAIQGFAQGVVGMRIGERRKIYVHPDLAYGQADGDHPQQLAIFDVQAISND